MSGLYTVSGPPGYVCLTRSVGPDWASQENYVAQVTPEEGRRIVAIVNEQVGKRDDARAYIYRRASAQVDQWDNVEHGRGPELECLRERAETLIDILREWVRLEGEDNA